MKTTYNTVNMLLVLIAFATTFACCKKSFVPKTPFGSNTISCKINGETFETSGADGGNNVSCHNEVVLTGGLNGSKINAYLCGGAYHTLYLTLWQDWAIGTFELGNGKGIGSCEVIKAMPSDSYVCSKSPEIGTLVITELTSTYIAGTFEFTAKELSGKTITVTEGKFDIAR
jgi:hypothetical protein